MALPRFFAAAIIASVMLTGLPVQANEIQDINQQFRAGDLTAALDHADRYLDSHPKDAQGRFLKGLILAELGKTGDAIDVLSRLAEDYPELPEPYNNLAVLYASQGKYGAAQDALESAIRAHPNYATAHENLGDLYAKMASIAYDKALTLDNRNSTAQTKLALIRNMLGEQARKPDTAKPDTVVPKPAPEPKPPAQTR